MPRCVINVFDQTKRRERKCLYNRKWCQFCSFHARKYAVKIQLTWRAYSTRKRVNLFKTLPDDLWNHILHFIILRNNTVKLLESHEKMYTEKILFVQKNWSLLRWSPHSISFYNSMHDSIDNRDYIRKILKTY